MAGEVGLETTSLTAEAHDLPPSLPAAGDPNGPPSLAHRCATAPQRLEALFREFELSLLKWDFFAAVRRLDCLADRIPPVGEALVPEQEAVRFGQEPTLNFPPTDLSRLSRPRVPNSPDGREFPPRLLVYFFGLLGTNGPLPLFMTELARNAQLRDKNPALAEFLDIFHHRMLSFYYRAWASCQQTVQFERHKRDRFSDYVGSLIGLGTTGARRRDRVSGSAKLHYAGRLICKARHPEGLEAILTHYFDVPTRIDEFVGKWADVPSQYRCRLGGGSRHACLGLPPESHDPDRSTAIVGWRVWDCQQNFRIRIGPLTWQDYQRMLPDGSSAGRLADWVRTYVGDELSWELRLVLIGKHVPKLLLGQSGKLGWSTWLARRPDAGDAEDLILQPEAIAAGEALRAPRKDARRTVTT